MAIRVNNVTLSIDEDMSLLKGKACKKLKISEKNIKSFKILKESIDARKKDNIKFNYCVEIECDNEEKIVKKAKDNSITLDNYKEEELIFGTREMKSRPVVVGFGPAGIFAALTLAQKGYKPIVFERGEDVDERSKTVDKFWADGTLNLDSNVQFGEGGAGAFSDGKLTTRIKDRRCSYVLEELVKSGGPEEIIYSGKPHIGTDILKVVVKNIREEIKSLGGEVHFNSKLEDIIYKEGKLEKIVVSGKELECENLILAIGHSARDTYEMLHKREVFMEQKAFAIGVRIEHPQDMINKAQYGEYANHERLKAADYKLVYQSEKFKRGVYSFCMCPGGVVVAAASEEKRLVSNGMSYHARDKENANSALVVTVGPEDFEGSHPLAGMDFQRHYERLAYELGGGGYKAPIQLVGDFLEDKNSTKLGEVIPSYEPGYEFKELKNCLPSYVVETIKEGIAVFDKRIKGYGRHDAVLTGIETRTSAPVRMLRNEKLQSVSVEGLYPTGEGAGFAGGIISAAVDGIKAAENVMKEYKKI
ncbi:MAG: FAD-dependent protein [Clostridium sp.]|uniref:NAD(P)/FAD-dependent oxidoreductase n=1 Tax=Clostridium sp. TaxID=1506 RepID=UPI003F3403B7